MLGMQLGGEGTANDAAWSFTLLMSGELCLHLCLALCASSCLGGHRAEHSVQHGLSCCR